MTKLTKIVSERLNNPDQLFYNLFDYKDER